MVIIERNYRFHGTDRTTLISDPIWCWYITLTSKSVNKKESIKLFENFSDNDESTLLIVDTQKSFKKLFSENYLNELKNIVKHTKMFIKFLIIMLMV
jgi:hypothetical protein